MICSTCILIYTLNTLHILRQSTLEYRKRKKLLKKNSIIFLKDYYTNLIKKNKNNENDIDNDNQEISQNDFVLLTLLQLNIINYDLHILPWIYKYEELKLQKKLSSEPSESSETSSNTNNNNENLNFKDILKFLEGENNSTSKALSIFNENNSRFSYYSLFIDDMKSLYYFIKQYLPISSMSNTSQYDEENLISPLMSEEISSSSNNNNVNVNVNSHSYSGLTYLSNIDLEDSFNSSDEEQL